MDPEPSFAYPRSKNGAVGLIQSITEKPIIDVLIPEIDRKERREEKGRKPVLSRCPLMADSADPISAGLRPPNSHNVFHFHAFTRSDCSRSATVFYSFESPRPLYPDTTTTVHVSLFRRRRFNNLENQASAQLQLQCPAQILESWGPTFSDSGGFCWYMIQSKFRLYNQFLCSVLL